MHGSCESCASCLDVLGYESWDAFRRRLEGAVDMGLR